MKIFISVFLVVSCFVIGLSQSDTLNQEINEIVIQENRISLPFSANSRSVSVITQEQIQAIPAKDIAELLTTVAGVDVRQRGVHGVQSDIGIRGGTFDQTLILLNGVKLIDPQTGHHSMNIPINIHAIERIEILKGAAARIFGQNGFSGAINIITKTSKTNALTLGINFGEHNALGLSIYEAIATEKSSHIISLNRNSSDGYKYNTDYKVENIFIQSKIEIENQDLVLTVGHSWREFGANGFYASPDFMDQYEEIITTIASASYNFQLGKWFIKPRLTYRKNQDDYVFVRDNPSIYQNIHVGQTTLGEVNAHRINKLGVFGVGVEYSDLKLSSNNLGERSRNLYTVFLEQRFNLLDNKLDITPGLSYSYYSDFDNKFFPGVDIGYAVNNQFKLFGNVGYTYRVPTYTDRFYEDPSNSGNPNLQPEEATSYEVGARYSTSKGNYQLSYFKRDGNDLIDWIKQSDTLKWTPVNIGQINSQGIDFSGTFKFNQNQFLDFANVGYTYIHANQKDVIAPFSRYALEHLNHQVVAGLQWHRSFFYHSIQFRYLDRENLDDYYVLDSKMTLKNKWGNFFISATNLLDQTYKESNLVTMPGRWLMTGVFFNLDY